VLREHLCPFRRDGVRDPVPLGRAAILGGLKVRISLYQPLLCKPGCCCLDLLLSERERPRLEALLEAWDSVSYPPLSVQDSEERKDQKLGRDNRRECVRRNRGHARIIRYAPPCAKGFGWWRAASPASRSPALERFRKNALAQRATQGGLNRVFAPAPA